MRLSGREQIVFVCALAVLCVSSSEPAEPSKGLYRCEKNGVPTFSDRPCGPDSKPYEPDSSRTSTYAPPPTNSASRNSTASDAALKKRRRSRAAAEMRRLAKHEQQCARIASSLAKVRAQMRSGYRASQGEQLRNREARLKEQWREKRCR
ncbi:MAG TPA: hypothetical protein VF193_01360 [Steroidobacter sp.]